MQYRGKEKGSTNGGMPKSQSKKGNNGKLWNTTWCTWFVVSSWQIYYVHNLMVFVFSWKPKFLTMQIWQIIRPKYYILLIVSSNPKIGKQQRVPFSYDKINPQGSLRIFVRSVCVHWLMLPLIWIVKK